MAIIILQALGWLAFIFVTIALGAWLRKNPSKRNAEIASEILHGLFWIGIVPAGIIGVFHPGLTGFDNVLGIKSLPEHPIVLALGIFVFLVGGTLILLSNMALWYLGKGAHAFFLTKRLVVGGIYMWTRNPMSLGLYLVLVGIGLLTKSTYMTVGTLLIVIPAHVFYLKYFEDKELELRMGQPYLEYKKTSAFFTFHIGFPQSLIWNDRDCRVSSYKGSEMKRYDLAAVLFVISALTVMAICFWTRAGILMARETARLLGWLVILSGMVLFTWAGMCLKVAFFGKVEPMTDEIITDGPYRKIRHPLYLSMIIALIGTSLMLRSFWGVLTIGMLFLPAVVYRARLEEKVLQAKFGRDWMNYQRRTSFLLPYLW